MQDSLNYDGLKHFYLLSSELSELNNLKGKSGSIATIVDTGAEYMYEEGSNQWYPQPSSGGGGITPAQLETYVQNNAIKKVTETPSASDYAMGDVIFDLSDQQIKRCVRGQSGSGKTWINITQLWLKIFKQTSLDFVYANKRESIIRVYSLPIATVDDEGQYRLLTTNNRVYKCENTGTTQSPVYSWVEKLCLAIDDLNSSDVPQSLDNKSKFYLTKESVTYNNQTVTGYTGYKKTSTAEEMGLIVDAEGIHIPTWPLDLPWSVLTTESSWKTYVLDNDFLIECELFEADCVCLTGTANNTWFATYIGNVSVSLPKLLYQDKNGVQVVVSLNSLEQILQAYQKKITAGAGLVFDGNTLKHSNSVPSKPQRYIRATAYDTQGHAINFGADYLVSRTDNNDDILSDSYLSSTLWVHAHYSPIEASSFINRANNSIPVNDCVFNMENIGGSTFTRRSQKRYMGLAKITNPINNVLLYGGIDVTEYWYQYVQEGTGTCRIEQVFKNSFNGNTGIAFKRFGSLALDSAGEFGTAIYTNRASIVWENWIPVDYPTTTIEKTSIVDEGSISFRIRSSILALEFSGLVIDTFDTQNAILGALPAGLQQGLRNTKSVVSNETGDVHRIEITSVGNILLWQKTNETFPILGISGTLIIPLG